MTRNETIAKVKELNIKTTTPPHKMKTEQLNELIAQCTENLKTTQRGRKINPESSRQLRFRLRAELLASGVEPTRGRKPSSDSARQQRLASFAERKANGEIIQRGRPRKK
jgi:hypothetical protein